LVIRIFPSPIRPHYYKKFGPEEGVYIRVGSTNRKADPEMIQELSRIVQNKTFDEQPLTKLSSEDIDFRAASEQFSKIKQLTPKDLETLEVLIDYQGKKVPTVAGLILFGKERAKFFPDAWIQAGRFKGTDKSFIVTPHVIPSAARDLPAVVHTKIL
jgi:predicted HTH transcriptional regulator